MKTDLLIYVVYMLLGGGVFASCGKEYKVYDANLAAVRFNLGNAPDSMVYSFALMPGVEEDTVKIPVRILGFTVPQNRKMNVRGPPRRNNGPGRGALYLASL